MSSISKVQDVNQKLMLTISIHFLNKLFKDCSHRVLERKTALLRPRSQDWKCFYKRVLERHESYPLH